VVSLVLPECVSSVYFACVCVKHTFLVGRTQVSEFLFFWEDLRHIPRWVLLAGFASSQVPISPRRTVLAPDCAFELGHLTLLSGAGEGTGPFLHPQLHMSENTFYSKRTHSIVREHIL
jgi:hypothetical protein